MSCNYVFYGLVALIASVAAHEKLDSYNVPAPEENVESNARQKFNQGINRDHIMEELQHQINMKSKEEMTDNELQFYYFKLHDYDNNNMLDGLEIVKALKHQQEEHGAAKSDDHLATDDSLIDIVDNVMQADDANLDGFITFHEFMSAQND